VTGKGLPPMPHASSRSNKARQDRATCALFDGGRFRRHLEAAYHHVDTIWKSIALQH
jgi:hypothetical protein